MAVEFKPGAEPGLKAEQGDMFRIIVERAGIGLFDRDNAVWETWERLGDMGVPSSFPFSSEPPLNVKAGVIDMKVREGFHTVTDIVTDVDKVAGRWANVFSIQPLTTQEVAAGAVNRESVRQAALDEGAGAGFSVIAEGAGDVIGDIADRLQTSTTIVLAAAAIAAVIFLPRLLRP